jgi:hypothetical protein
MAFIFQVLKTFPRLRKIIAINTISLQISNLQGKKTVANIAGHATHNYSSSLIEARTIQVEFTDDKQDNHSRAPRTSIVTGMNHPPSLFWPLE